LTGIQRSPRKRNFIGIIKAQVNRVQVLRLELMAAIDSAVNNLTKGKTFLVKKFLHHLALHQHRYQNKF
jgi:hypothetical protein